MLRLRTTTILLVAVFAWAVPNASVYSLASGFEESTLPWYSDSPMLLQDSEVVHALWICNGELFHATQREKLWTEAFRVAKADNLSSKGVKLSADGRVNVLFSVWLDKLEPASEIYYVYWVEGEGWSLPRLVSKTPYHSVNAALFVDLDGVMHGVWQDWQPVYGSWWIRYGCFDPLQAATSGVSGLLVGEPETVSWGLWSSEPIPSALGIQPDVWADSKTIFVAWSDVGEVFLAARLLWLGKWSSAWNVSDSVEESVLERMGDNPRGNGVAIYWQEDDGKLWWTAAWFDELGRITMTDKWRMHHVYLQNLSV